MKHRLLVVILVSLTVSTAMAVAEPVTPQLTGKLSRLLQQEMRSIQAAMGTIHTAMVTGEHKTVAQNAQQIHDSFILKQSMTEQDRSDLMAAVPKDFLKLDQQFHKLAADLAEAGTKENTQQQQQIYSKMTGACIACHTKYVSDRFPGLDSGK